MIQSAADFYLDALQLLLANPSDEVRILMKTVLAIYQDETVDLDDKRIALYVMIIKELLTSEVDTENRCEIAGLMLKFEQHPYVEENAELKVKLQLVLNPDNKPSARRVATLLKRVNTWVLWHQSNRELRRMFAKSQQCATTFDLDQQMSLMNEVLCHAKAMVKVHETTTTQPESMVDSIDLTDADSIRKAIRNYALRSNTNVWRLGSQGMGRMFTKWGGGIKRGSFGCIISLSHQYKSGRLLDMMRWFATYNVPIVKPGQKPTLVFFSLENELNENLVSWYKTIYMHEHLTQPDMSATTEDQIIQTVKTYFSQKGYTALVYRELGDCFGIKEYKKRIEELMHTGYDVQAVFIDYLGLMRTEDDDNNQAKRFQKLASSLSNYNQHLGITTVTAWQMAGEAEKLCDGRTYVVKSFNFGLLADAKALARELEWAIFQHIERNDATGVIYLTQMMRKLRYADGRDAKQDFAAEPFHPTYGLLDDIHSKDRSVTDLYTGGTSADLFADLAASQTQSDVPLVSFAPSASPSAAPAYNVIPTAN